MKSSNEKKPKVIQTTLSLIGNLLRILTTLPDQTESGKAKHNNIQRTHRKMKGKGATTNRSSKYYFRKLDKIGQNDKVDQLDQPHPRGCTI